MRGMPGSYSSIVGLTIVIAVSVFGVCPAEGYALSSMPLGKMSSPSISFDHPHHRLSPLHLRMQDGLSSQKLFNRRNLLTGMFAMLLPNLTPASGNAFGTGEREVGEIPASGFIFKDTIKVTAFKDPKVEGVDLYVSDFQRPITERLQKDFFSDPSFASIGCARTSDVVKVSKDIYKGKDGEEVFEQARSLLFKSLRVRRLYDVDTKTLVYVSYSTRFNKDDDSNKSRFKTATCAVHVDFEE